MNRLAETVIELINELHTERLNYESEYLPLIEAANRLAAYEDSGLEPEEAQQLVNKQKWHVVADGDLPTKNGYYLITIEMFITGGKYKKGKLVREVKQAYFKMDSEYIVGYVWWNLSEIDDRYVLAWRELPDPWEGSGRKPND